MSQDKPSTDYVIAVEVDGVAFEVAVDAPEPDEPRGFVHPDNFWVSDALVNGRWVDPQSWFSKGMCSDLDRAAQREIARRAEEADHYA